MPYVYFRYYRNSDTGTLHLVQVGGGTSPRGFTSADNQEAVSGLIKFPSAEAVWRNPGTKQGGFSERGVWREDDKWSSSAQINDITFTINSRIADVWAANSGAATATLLAAMNTELTAAGWL